MGYLRAKEPKSCRTLGINIVKAVLCPGCFDDLLLCPSLSSHSSQNLHNSLTRPFGPDLRSPCSGKRPACRVTVARLLRPCRVGEPGPLFESPVDEAGSISAPYSPVTPLACSGLYYGRLRQEKHNCPTRL